MAPPINLFWDSCVFHAWLAEENQAYDLKSIGLYLDDAKSGKCKIYTSSVACAEVLPSKIKKPEIGSFTQFMNDFAGAFVVVDASMNLVALAGQLRDIPYRKQNETRRRLHTPDAIMLATCLQLNDVFGVSIDYFHTFDAGKKKGPEGNSIPLLGYETWCDGLTGEHLALAKKVIALKRCKPAHPSPGLF